MDFCEVQRFTNQEIQFIQEHCEVMTPFAESLDFFQGEEAMFMSYLLPTLYALDKKLIILQQKRFNFCDPFVNTIRTSVQTRISTIWEKKELILAACLLPRFKLLWLDGANRFIAEAWLKSLFENVGDGSSSEAGETEYSSRIAGTSKEDFFCLPVDTNSNRSSSNEELELYLKCQSKELSVLLYYPAVLKMFLKFNTPLPSSAPVERLFSTCSNVMTQKRHKLSDSLFEKLVLLNHNKIGI